ncbi:hypothetical protein SKAU_G00423410 [Synaphobranchus kaupii]|uniref:Uncharacterized protein n=1 Tax=Synaphobranchus kaupii TaxID=118154 RepID=A0A9Q1IAJ1_SYNKA|nr:hypothetical protein SKAU_G00423410 [Synaphobranchus kaupii]
MRNVALTTDCWTALTTESYITVTRHYIEQDWQVKLAVLLTESMSVRHTADNLAEKLNQAVESRGLTGRVIACVHDNRAEHCLSDNPTHSVPCFSHTLQLAVNDGVAAYLNRAVAAAGRWNSVCDMFGRLVEQRWAVSAVLSDRTVTRLPDARALELRRVLAADGGCGACAGSTQVRNYRHVC